MNTRSLVQNKASSTFTPVSSRLLQRKCDCGRSAGLAGKCTACENKPLTLQRRSDDRSESTDVLPVIGKVSRSEIHASHDLGQGSDTAPASVDQVLASPGKPLDPLLQRDMEQRFGHDFSKVRIHSGAAAEQSARDVNARAYTAGRNIVFGSGQFSPGTQEGRRLIAHELAHVVQQSGPAGINSDQTGGKRDLSPSAHTIQRQESGANNIDEDGKDQSLALAEPEESTPVATADITQSLAAAAAAAPAATAAAAAAGRNRRHHPGNRE